MSAEMWVKLATDLPLLAVLLLVLWKGGQKLDKIGERLDKMTNVVKTLSSKIELIGKIQDMRLELHEERTNAVGGHVDAAVVVSRHAHPGNGAVPPAPMTPRGARPSWLDVPADPEDE